MPLGGALGAELERAGFTPVPSFTVGGQVVPAWRRARFRWEWMATRLHVFVVLLEPSAGDNLPDLAQASRRAALACKGGLPRGFQTGVAVVPVVLAPGAGPPERLWVASRQPKAFASFCYPVLADPGARWTACRTASQPRGRLYEPELFRTAGLVADGLGLPRPPGRGPAGAPRNAGLARVLGVMAALELLVALADLATGRLLLALCLLASGLVLALQALVSLGERPNRSEGTPARQPGDHTRG